MEIAISVHHFNIMVESKVKDMGLAEFGRKELTFAEHEMLGLRASTQLVCQAELAQPTLTSNASCSF